MTTETVRLPIKISAVAIPTEQLKKLRAETENLTKGSAATGLEKTRQQAEELQKQLIPMYGKFSETANMVQTLAIGLGPLGLAITGIGVLIGAATVNVMRFTSKFEDALQRQRELGIHAASAKKIEEALKEALVPEEIARAGTAAISRLLADIKTDGSQLTRGLRDSVRALSKEFQDNMEGLIKFFRGATPEEAVNEIKRQYDAIYQQELDRTKNEVVARERANEFLKTLNQSPQIYSKPFKHIANATKAEKEVIETSIKRADEFAFQLARSSVAIGKIRNEIAARLGRYEATFKVLGVIAKMIARRAAMAKKSKDILEGKATIFENPFRAGKPSIQKQSYSGGGEGGGARVILASYSENVIRLKDDANVTRALAIQVRDLNDFLRRSRGGGGAGAIRASLGGPSGGYGGSGGYGRSGTGTRGSGGGRTGNDTIGPSTPPSVPGMLGVQPGDLGMAGVIRAGKKPDLLTSLLGPTGEPQMAPAGGVGGMASILGAGAAGAGAGVGAAGAGPIPGVGAVSPRLRMPELPHGVPYGASGAALYLSGAPDAAVDAALKMEGLHEQRDVQALKSYLHGWKSGKGDWDPRGGDNPWCAVFVGASLAKAGIKGTDSAMATSYLNWAERVTEGYKKGDVVVMSRGGGTPTHGAQGHIGMLTGRYDPKTGNYETIEGNIKDKVVFNWRNLGALNVRRATERERMEAASQQQPTAAGPAAAGGDARAAAVASVSQFSAAPGRDPFTATAYWDVNRWTYGYGTDAPSQGSTISQADALKIQQAALGKSYDKIRARWPNAPDGVIKSLMDLDFNAGFMSSSKKGAVALKAALDRGDWTTARSIFLERSHINADTPQERVLPGLAKRRADAVAGLWDKGPTTTSAPIIVPPSFKESMRPAKPLIRTDTAGIDRALGGEVKSKVNGTGQIEVDVKGPSGTKVTAEAPQGPKPNIFKRASVNRVKEPPAPVEKPAAAAGRTASRTDEE